MAGIVVTKTGDILAMVYDSPEGRFDEYARNMVTGHNIALLNDSAGVETTILCKREIIYTYGMFDTVDSGSGAVSITTNKILFDELKNML